MYERDGRQKTDLSFSEVVSAIDKLDLPQIDFVVGVGRGGVVPASLVAAKLGCDLAIVEINYRDDENRPRHEAPVSGPIPGIPENVRSILIVDDVSVSGVTMERARELFQSFEVSTLVLKGRADFVAFPDVRTCVNWPWKPQEPVASINPLR